VAVTILHAVILQEAVNQELKGRALLLNRLNLDASLLVADLVSDTVDDVKANAGGLLHDHLFLAFVAEQPLEVCQSFGGHPDPSILYGDRDPFMPILFLIFSPHPNVPRVGEFSSITDQVG